MASNGKRERSGKDLLCRIGEPSEIGSYKGKRSGLAKNPKRKTYRTGRKLGGPEF